MATMQRAMPAEQLYFTKGTCADSAFIAADIGGLCGQWSCQQVS